MRDAARRRWAASAKLIISTLPLIETRRLIRVAARAFTSSIGLRNGNAKACGVPAEAKRPAGISLGRTPENRGTPLEGLLRQSRLAHACDEMVAMGALPVGQGLRIPPDREVRH